MNLKPLLNQLGITRFLAEEEPGNSSLAQLEQLMGDWPHAQTLLNSMGAVSSQPLTVGGVHVGYWLRPFLDRCEDAIMPPAGAIGLVCIASHLSGDFIFVEPRAEGVMWFLDHEVGFSLEGMDFDEACQLIKENVVPGFKSLEPFLERVISDKSIHSVEIDLAGIGMIGTYTPPS